MKRFFARNYEEKIILGTSDTWLTSHLSHQPSEPAYYIVDWKIFTFVLGTPKGEDNQGQRPPSHALSADDKAAKVAALSQALDFIDKFRKSQESKEDKTGGPDEEEINDLATNLQEASQGAPTKSNQTLHIVGGKWAFHPIW